METEADQRHGDFHAKKAGAEDDSPLCASGSKPKRLAISLAPQAVDAREHGSRHGQRYRGRPSRYQKPPVPDLFAPIGGHGLSRRIDSDYLRVQFKFDRPIAIEALLMDEELGLGRRSEQELFGEGWPMARGQFLSRQNKDRAGRPFEPQPLGCGRAGKTPAARRKSTRRNVMKTSLRRRSNSSAPRSPDSFGVFQTIRRRTGASVMLHDAASEAPDPPAPSRSAPSPSRWTRCPERRKSRTSSQRPTSGRIRGPLPGSVSWAGSSFLAWVSPILSGSAGAPKQEGLPVVKTVSESPFCHFPATYPAISRSSPRVSGIKIPHEPLSMRCWGTRHDS